jgi:hypothetical protein
VLLEEFVTGRELWEVHSAWVGAPSERHGTVEHAVQSNGAAPTSGKEVTVILSVSSHLRRATET